jgi:hypothetical protein
MKRPLLTVTLMTTLFAAVGCGGGAASAPEPLLSTTLTGQYKGQPFTPTFGVATIYQGSNLIALGDGPLNCSSAQQTDPPMGTTVTFSVPTLDVATYSSVFIDLVQYKGGSFDGVGSSDGTVALTAVSATSVAGTIGYSYPDSATGGTYALSGSFEVSRCPM